MNQNQRAFSFEQNTIQQENYKISQQKVAVSGGIYAVNEQPQKFQKDQERSLCVKHYA